MSCSVSVWTPECLDKEVCLDRMARGSLMRKV